MGTLRLSLTDAVNPSYEQTKALKKTSCWTPPTYIGFQAPVPPAPDYSTPKAVNARIREFCGTPWLSTSDTSFKRVWKAFRAVVAPMRCRIEDTHQSKWRIARGCIRKGEEFHECRTNGYRHNQDQCVEGYILLDTRTRTC